MERHTNWAVVLGTSLASAGLTAGLLLGLGAGQARPRAHVPTESEFSTSRMEQLLEQLIERLDRGPVETASTIRSSPSTPTSGTALVSPERSPTQRVPVDAGLVSAIAALRKSIDAMAASSQFEPAVVFSGERELDRSALELLKVRYPGEEGPDAFMLEYQLQPVEKLLERFGQPTGFWPGDNGCCGWSWALEDTAEVSVTVFRGLITEVDLWVAD